MSTAVGYAVLYNGEIQVKTVSETKIGAIINWLYTKYRIPVPAGTSDESVEAVWGFLTVDGSPMENVVPVSINVNYT
jgi:hypothetical protein